MVHGIVETQTLGPLAGRQRMPVFGGLILGELGRVGLDQALLDQEAQVVVGADRQDV